MSREKLLEKLKKGLILAKIDLTESIQEKLVTYLELLIEWNLIHNLTGTKDPEQLIYRHLIDSLSLMPYLNGDIITTENKPRIIDVGTGAGLPGIPLSLAYPNWTFVLIDSNQKKINFVQHAIISLNLENVSVYCGRVEQYHPQRLFNLVISRAFASLADFLLMTEHLVCEQGAFLAMKGKKSMVLEEIAEVPKNFRVEDIIETRNLLEEERTLLLIKRI